jgi:hypothetical protein
VVGELGGQRLGDVPDEPTLLGSDDGDGLLARGIVERGTVLDHERQLQSRIHQVERLDQQLDIPLRPARKDRERWVPPLLVVANELAVRANALQLAHVDGCSVRRGETAFDVGRDEDWELLAGRDDPHGRPIALVQCASRAPRGDDVRCPEG